MNRAYLEQSVAQELASRGLRVERYPLGLSAYGLDVVDNNGQVIGNAEFVDVPLTAACASAMDVLRRRHPGVHGATTVTLSGVADHMQGTGLGYLMYEYALLDAARRERALAPDTCRGGSTSASARRVWRKLAEHYPVEGSVVFGGE